MAGSSPDDAHKRLESALQKKWLAWCALIAFAGAVLFVNFLSVSDSIELASMTSSMATSTRARKFLQEGSLVHHYVQDEDGEDVLPPLLPPPHKWPLEEGMDEQCLYVRDYGLLERLDNSRQSFCTDDEGGSSPYTFYSVPESGLQATRFDNLILDWRGARVARDITSLAQDGMNHDPRFKYKHNATYCSCGEPQDQAHGAPYIWKNFVDGGPGKNDTMCQAPPSDLPVDVLNVSRAILLSRKDDHNPFFQIAGIFNAWIMMNVLGWSRTTTQLVTFDRAWPSPVDELRHAVLGPERPIINGETIQERVIHFDSVFFAPHEARGTLINHLDIAQPCYANAMVSDFRDLALKSLDVRPRHEKTNPRRCLVTIISRRPYGGRAVQRVWQNESDVLDHMREDYGEHENVSKIGGCAFQSLDFVNLTMHDQMRVVVDSDVVIGMHGAGMVNVLWARPGTLVVEIFPTQKHRGGYRNICQFIGCAWHEFRGGEDIVVRSTDPNDLDKTIPYPEWKQFFDPLFQDFVARLAKSRLPQELQ